MKVLVRVPGKQGVSQATRQSGCQVEYQTIRVQDRGYHATSILDNQRTIEGTRQSRRQTRYQAIRMPCRVPSNKGTRKSRCHARYQAIRVPDRVSGSEGARPGTRKAKC